MFGLNKKTDLSKGISEWIVAEFKRVCPEPEPEMSEFYLASFWRVSRWLGRMGERPLCPMGLTVPEVNLLLGCHAMQMVEASNYRAWSQARNLQFYQRVAFQRSLVVSITMCLQSQYVTKSSESTRWRPFCDEGEEFFHGQNPKRFTSNIFLSGQCLEQAVFHHLFPEAVTGYGDQMAGLAVIDSFASPPDPDNPIVMSLRRALRKVFLRHRIQQSFEMKRWLMESYPTLLTELVDHGVKLEDEQVSEDDENAAGSEHDAQPGPSERTTESIDRVQRRAIGSQEVAALIRSAVAEGVVNVSCPKAPFHGFRGVPCLVWPAGVRTLAHHIPRLTEGDLRKVFEQSGWLHEDGGGVATDEVFFAVQKDGRLVKRASAKMAPLTEQGVSALLPKGKISDNPALVLPDEIS